MSANVKIGDDIIHNATAVRLESADTAGEYVTFSEGGQPTLFAPSITQNLNNVTFANNANNGGFNVTLRATINGASVTSPFSATENMHGETLSVEASADNFQSAITTKVISYYFSVTKTAANGTLSGDANIEKGGTGTYTFTPATGFLIPNTVTVSGCDYTYDNTTGVITISNPTANVTISSVGVIADVPTNYLTFSSPAAFTFKMASSSGTAKYYSGTLYYSTDKTNWNEVVINQAVSSVEDSGTHYIYVCGKGNERFCTTDSYYNSVVLTGANVSCEGSLESLLDWEEVNNGNHPTIPAGYIYAFANFFRNNTALISCPKMLSQRSYYTSSGAALFVAMYRGCTNLVTIPELPATTFSAVTYASMFRGCSKIKISTTQTGEYVNEYRVPMTGTGTSANLDYFVRETGGTFTGNLASNTTYYTSNTIVPATPL